MLMRENCNQRPAAHNAENLVGPHRRWSGPGRPMSGGTSGSAFGPGSGAAGGGVCAIESETASKVALSANEERSGRNDIAADCTGGDVVDKQRSRPAAAKR